jgi:hypothetical protein
MATRVPAVYAAVMLLPTCSLLEPSAPSTDRSPMPDLTYIYQDRKGFAISPPCKMLCNAKRIYMRHTLIASNAFLKEPRQESPADQTTVSMNECSMNQRVPSYNKFVHTHR